MTLKDAVHLQDTVGGNWALCLDWR